MKKLRSISWKQLGVMSTLFLLFTCSTIFLFSYKRDEKSFHSLTSRLFISEMTENTLNMHYTIANPETFGIYHYTPVLSYYDTKNAEKEYSYTQNILNQLYRIHPDKLSKDDQYTYSLLVKTLENNLALEDYPYYSEPLSPASGVQSQLPILFAEYTFRNVRDVEDYLVLLGQTNEYFASILTYEQEKKEAGLFMASSTARKVISQCKNIITKEELEAGTNFLQTTFNERLDQLISSGLLSKTQAVQYVSQNNELLSSVLLPAYLSLADGMESLMDENISLQGISSKPNGRKYYELYLTHLTGSYRDIDEIRNMLLTSLSEEWNILRELADKYPAAMQLYTSDQPLSFPLNVSDTMLNNLKERMDNIFPEFYDVDVSIKKVSPSLEKYSAPAFYLTPPIDDYDSNVIYINPSAVSDGLELYTTLAHEGYPGHLYQTVYNDYRLHVSNQKPIRSILWYGGYVEGWAIYSEFLAYDYASKLMEEEGLFHDAAVAQLEKHNRSLQICLYCLLDLMINYENAVPTQVAAALKDFGITSAESVNAIYSYIAEEPCNYLKYYLGYLELLDLKNEAAKLWGDDFTEYRFHKFYLECGPSDFTSMHEKLLREES